MRLPPELVQRRPPLGLREGDGRLFQHEYRLELGEVTLRTVDADMLPNGLLVRPDTARLLDVGFQQGRPTGLGGVKARLRAWQARLGYPRTLFGSEGARTPLVITDEFSNGFFHWVADALPKLAWLGDELSRYELILPSFATRFPYMAQSLALWPQLTVRVVPPQTRLALTNAVVVPALAPTGNYRPALTRALGASWRQAVLPQSPFRRVYVSRSKAPWRKIANEDAVWAALSARGFERIFLEDLSFRDQVRLAAEAAVLVSNHGAGLTAATFMVPGTRVLEIRLANDAHNNCYYSLADAIGLEYTYLTAPEASRGQDVHTADLLVDVPSLLRTLEFRA